MGDENNQNNNQVGGDLPAWHAQLPDGLKGNEYLKGFKTFGDACQEHLAIKERASKSVVIPGEKSTPEEREAFYKAYGRPDKADGYTLPEFKELPEGVALNKELEAGFKTLSHELGLNSAQAAKLYEFYGNFTINNIKNLAKAQTEAKDNAVQTLKNEWKQDYDKNLEIAKRAYKEFGNEELTKYLDESGIGNNPLMLKAFHAIALKVADDSVINGQVDNTKKPVKGFVYDKSPDLYPKS